MTTKYTLVPVDQLGAQERYQRSQAYQHIKNLDGNIRNVLNDDSLPEADKYAQYRQILSMHSNLNRVDDGPRQHRNPPPPPVNYMDGLPRLFEKPAFGRAYAKPAIQHPVLDEEEDDDSQTASPFSTPTAGSSKYTPVWSNAQLDKLKQRVTHASSVTKPSANAMVDVLSTHFGRDVDYASPVKKSGIRIGGKTFRRSNLESVIKNLNDPDEYSTEPARELAQFLISKVGFTAIPNKDIQNMFMATPLPPKRPRKGTLPFTPAKKKQDGYGLVGRWKCL